jgi:hypothetical protein
VLVVVEDVEEAKAVVADVLKTLAELTSVPLLRLTPEERKRHIRRDFASSAT